MYLFCKIHFWVFLSERKSFLSLKSLIPFSHSSSNVKVASVRLFPFSHTTQLFMKGGKWANVFKGTALLNAIIMWCSVCLSLYVPGTYSPLCRMIVKINKKDLEIVRKMTYYSRFIVVTPKPCGHFCWDSVWLMRLLDWSMKNAVL